MSFWIIATLVALFALAPIALAMFKAPGKKSAHETATTLEKQVYRDQLAEVDRDLARGVLSKEDAERTKIEVSRRLLDADKSSPTVTAKTRQVSPWLIGAMMVVFLGAGIYLYTALGAPGYPDLPLERRFEIAQENRDNRPSQAEAEANTPPARAIQETDPQHLELLEKLRGALESRPDDLEGFKLLARNEAVIGNYRAAYVAQERIIELKGEAASDDDFANLADMMILAAGGFVSPEAETNLTRSLALNPKNGPARYYSAVMFIQNGRPDIAFRLWSQLLSDGPADAPWIAPIRAQIEPVAQAAGIRYTLPPLPNGAGADGLSGPSAEDMAAAADMTADERAEMIRGMVDGLSARLANEGGTPEEWGRLIFALAQLGETARARAIWGEAQVTFGANPDAMNIVRAQAVAAGLLE